MTGGVRGTSPIERGDQPQRRVSDHAHVPTRGGWRFRWLRHRYWRRIYLVLLIPIYAVAAVFVGVWIGANEVIREWWADWRLP